MFSSKAFSVMLAACMLFSSQLMAQLDDPTRPPGYRLSIPGGVKSREQTFSLSSVYISAARRAAVINGKTVKKGSIINGARVIAIEPSEVKLKRDGKVISVRLLSGSISKKVSRKSK